MIFCNFMLIYAIGGFCLFNSCPCVTVIKRTVFPAPERAFLPGGAKQRGMLFQLKKKVDNGITVVRCDNLLEIDFVKNRFFIAHTHDSYGVTGYAHETCD